MHMIVVVLRQKVPNETPDKSSSTTGHLHTDNIAAANGKCTSQAIRAIRCSGIASTRVSVCPSHCKPRETNNIANWFWGSPEGGGRVHEREQCHSPGVTRSYKGSLSFAAYRYSRADDNFPFSHKPTTRKANLDDVDGIDSNDTLALQHLVGLLNLGMVLHFNAPAVQHLDDFLLDPLGGTVAQVLHARTRAGQATAVAEF